MVERRVQLIDGVGTKGVAHLGAVERNAHGADLACPVIGDVGEGETRNRVPCGWIEDLRYHEEIL